jgi:hypothetical protein
LQLPVAQLPSPATLHAARVRCVNTTPSRYVQAMRVRLPTRVTAIRAALAARTEAGGRSHET